jgi:hypothetical protein
LFVVFAANLNCRAERGQQARLARHRASKERATMATRVATCACGSLQVRCTGDPVRVSLCHCLDYQRRTGTYGVAAFFRSQDVEAQGATRRFTRRSDSGRTVTFQFCPACGSTVLWSRDGKAELTAVVVGAFADPGFPAPSQAVYGERSHPWVAFSDGPVK